jgi:hypothetical protein
MISKYRVIGITALAVVSLTAALAQTSANSVASGHREILLQTPAAEASVRAARPPARRVSGRSAAQSLDGRRSGGYARHRCPTLSFQHVHAQQPPRLRKTTSERPFSA